MNKRNQRVSALAPIPNFYRIPGSRVAKAQRYYTGTIRGARYKLTRKFGIWTLTPVNAPCMPSASATSAAGALRKVIFKTKNWRKS